MSKIIFSWKVDFNPCLITQRLWPGSAQALFSRIVCLWVDSKQGTLSSKETASPKRGSQPCTAQGSGLRTSHSPGAPTLCYVSEALSSQEHLKVSRDRPHCSSIQGYEVQTLYLHGTKGFVRINKTLQSSNCFYTANCDSKLKESFFYDKESWENENGWVCWRLHKNTHHQYQLQCRGRNPGPWKC